MNDQKDKFALSVVIIALNEEANISRAIRSAMWAGEVLVYDSGSTDKTCEVAQKLGARVITGPWYGFGATKRKASELASYDWVFSLDADEEISPELQAEIQQLSTNLLKEVCYQIPRQSNYLGRWIRYGGWYPDFQIRVFNRQNTNWNLAEIHEKVEGEKIISFKNKLYHYVFKNIEHQVQTNNKYSGLLAQQMFKQNKTFSWFHYLTKPCVKFIECYYLKLGFLDGWPGYLIAKNAAYSVFLKWSKLKELGERQNNP